MKTLQIYIPKKDAGRLEHQLRAIREAETRKSSDPLAVPSMSAIIRQAIERWYEELQNERRA